MQALVQWPKIVTLANRFGGSHSGYYDKIVIDSLQGILAKKLEKAPLEEILLKELPLVTVSSIKEPPFYLSLYLLCRKRGHAGKFFSEMVSRWLIPGKLLSSPLCLITDFMFESMPEAIYTLVEIQVPIERQWDC